MARREVKKISGELFALTYGSLVAQLIKDYESVDEINKQLEKMGFNIGVRLIDDFLAHSGINKCANFAETADVIVKTAFKMYLGVTPIVTNWNSEKTECSLMIEDNPLTAFVELPPERSGLLFSNLLCGVLRGALEMIQMKVEAKFVKDVLRGDETTELRLRLIEIMHDEAPKGDE